MNTSIVGRHIKLTDAIKDYINSSIDTFKKYNLDIISVTSTIVGDEKAKGFTCEISLNIANIDTVVIKQKDKDLYTAINNSRLNLSNTDKVAKELNVTLKGEYALRVR